MVSQGGLASAPERFLGVASGTGRLRGTGLDAERLKAFFPEQGEMSPEDQALTPEAVDALGEAWYAGLAERLEAEHYGKVVVIHALSGDYVIGKNDLEATRAMDELHPNSWNWGRRIGGDGAVAQFSPAMTLAYYEQEKKTEREELIQKGEAIYAGLAARLEAECNGQVIVIDVRSGDYEVAADKLTATLGILARQPQALNWGRNIGGAGAAAAPFRARMTLEYL